ncbi:MAG: DUF4118 domain-containing protein [Gemmatimonadetes bacterium]|nr:DUF4118 domain-containing protein [Gemmatimonadota bacterium]
MKQVALEGVKGAAPAGERSLTRRYGAAVLASIAALVITALLRPWLGQTIYLFFFPAVMVSAWYGGILPGCLTAVTGAIAADLLFLDPVGSLEVSNPISLATAGVLLVTAWLVNALARAVEQARAEAERRAVQAEEMARSLEEQATELEAQVETNQALVARLGRANERLQKAAVQAQAASRAKSAFLATMSHELRTPLNAIDGYAELIEMGIYGNPTPEQANAVARIRASHRVLLALIDQVLDQAKIEAGKLELTVRPVPIAEAVATACGIAEPLARARGIRLRRNAVDPRHTAHADAVRLEQILINLTTNAVKFTAPGGEIAIGSAAEGGRVRIDVSDTGAGIPEDKLESIFEPFYQLDQSSTRVEGGAGLGLTISRDLARAMAGDISVSSELGRGSIFTVTLPLADPAASAPPAS